MKNIVLLPAAACAVVLFLSPAPSMAADPGISSKPANCDTIAEAVMNDVKKDPRKVLMVVEDYMVSNQGCAAAIVKAAIEASRADAEMRKQIAITATHIAPDMAKTIEDTLAALSPADAGAVQVAVQKEADSESPQLAQTQTSGNTGSGGGGSDYNLPTDLRGVFFIEPLSLGGGVTTSSQTSSSSPSASNNSGGGGGNPHVHTTTAQNTPPHQPFPLSPSSGP